MSGNSENTTILELCERIGSDNSEAVRKELLSELAGKEKEPVILDAARLTYISGAGIRMLLQTMKSFPDVTMMNVCPDVYEVLEMAGITEVMTVEKAVRTISVEGCEVIGEGANGKVYRIDRETVVKLYKNDDALPEIRKEQQVARLALILGIPTAVSYDVVRVGDGYGAVFELLNARSFSKILAEQPEKMDWCVREYVEMLKKIHSTAVPEGKLPSVNLTARGWVGRMKTCLPPEQGQKLQAMVDAIPDRNTLIHGDYHTKNIVLSGEEVLLIDMDTLSTGHPIFELAQMYCAFIGFSELNPQKIEAFQGFDDETARTFWRKSLKAYLDTEDDEAVTQEENRIRCVAYARLIDWSMRHDPDGEEGLAERELWKRELMSLLAHTDTLIFEMEKETAVSKKAPLNPPEKTPVFEMLLNSKQVLRTDLHMHTTVSDGTDTPEELLACVRKAGIPLFSVTDHDSLKGCSIILDSLRDGDPHFIVGAEFSCKDEGGQYHILGYGFDPDAYAIRKLMEIGHAYRIRKLRSRLNYLENILQIRLPDEAVKKLYAMDNPGKPHLGNLMAKYGFAPSKDLAISTLLNRIHFVNEYLRPEEAVIGILAAGGIPVLAHPSFGSGNQQITGEALEQRLKTLISYGLMGVEAFYSGFSKEQSSEVLALAGKYGLYVTAGSDYHGKNKQILPGNTGMASISELPDGFRRFLKDVKRIR